jgi:hypothetical protein
MIGQALSGSPVVGDTVWPHEAVRDVIEEVASDDPENGFMVGLLNSRGIRWRNLYDGGSQERQLVEKYTGFASTVSDQWPRNASVLRRIADLYRADAR